MEVEVRLVVVVEDYEMSRAVLRSKKKYIK